MTPKRLEKLPTGLDNSVIDASFCLDEFPDQAIAVVFLFPQRLIMSERPCRIVANKIACSKDRFYSI